jgi:hypothetical protein
LLSGRAVNRAVGGIEPRSTSSQPAAMSATSSDGHTRPSNTMEGGRTITGSTTGDYIEAEE